MCLLGFAMCNRHTANPLSPVVIDDIGELIALVYSDIYGTEYSNFQEGAISQDASSWPEESRVRAAGALVGGVLEVVGSFLERVPSRQ